MKIYDIEKIKNPIIYICIAFISGSLFFAFFNNRYIWLAVLTVSLFFIAVYKDTNSIFTLILLIFFSLSLFNCFSYYNLKLQEDFKGDIIITGEKSYYAVGNFKGRVIYLENMPKKLKIGEKINISGKFSKKNDFENGSIGTIKIKKVNDEKETFRRKLYSLREKVYENLKENIGERKSALISSAAFGYTDNLDEEDKEEMRNLGVIHAVSVSGLHVALIYSVLKRIAGIRLSLFITAVYVILTGAAFSSIRALIMIILLNSALIVKKTYNPLGALAFSAGIITLFRPYAPYKTGFQLSFLAALGIILFLKMIKDKLYKLPKYLNNTLSVSISAQVFILPIMMFQFGQYSFLFLLGNLVLIPLLNILIYLGNLMLIVVFIPEVFDFLSYAALKVINVFDNITDCFDLMFNGNFFVNQNIAMSYTFILLGMYLAKNGMKKAKIFPLAVVITLIFNIYSPFLRVDYLKEGGLLIAYRGERKIVTNKKNVDIKKLKEKNMAKEAYRETKAINIGNNIKLNLKGKNYILNLKDKKYLLRLDNKENEDKNYDIIDFANKNVEGFYIVNGKVYCF